MEVSFLSLEDGLIETEILSQRAVKSKPNNQATVHRQCFSLQGSDRTLCVYGRSFARIGVPNAELSCVKYYNFLTKLL